MGGLLESCVELPLRERIGGPLVVLLLAGVAALGIHMMFDPGRYMKRSMRRGGRLRQEWDELQMCVLGAIVAGVSVWIGFEQVRSIWHACAGGAARGVR